MAAIYYPPPQPQRSVPRVVQGGVSLDSPPPRRLADALPPIYAAWLPVHEAIRNRSAVRSEIHAPFVSTLHLDWLVAARPEIAGSRLRLTWLVIPREGGQIAESRLHLSWWIGRPAPALHLTWLGISPGLATAHASRSNQPTASVRLDTDLGPVMLRATRFALDSDLSQPADFATVDVAASASFQAAEEGAAVSLDAGYVQDGTPETIALIDGGVVTFYLLKLDQPRRGPTRLTGQLKARDAMAALMDTEYRLLYRNGPTPQVTDGSLQTPEVNGLFRASEIARQVVSIPGLDLFWDAPDYAVHDSFSAIGRPIDILRSLLRPFSVLPAIQADVYTFGTTLFVRQRRPLTWSAPVANTFTLADAKVRSLQIRKFRTDPVGLVSLQGMRTDGPSTGDSATPTDSGRRGGGIPILSWPQPPDITWPTALSAVQLDARADVPGTFTYSPGEGTSPEPGDQTLRADFYPDDTAAYKSGSISAKLHVNKIATTVVWADPASIDDSTPLSGTQLNATAVDPESNPITGSFTYKPGSGVTLPAGEYTLTVKFHPSDSTHYADATGTAHLTVTGTIPPTTPAITWADPAGLVEGEALSATQLNATADTSGTFAYTPDSGTVLDAGTHTLRVVFTPDDPVTYKIVTADAQITVTRVRLQWRPTGIQAGAALGSGQLNATANVPGAFDYSSNPTGTIQTQPGIIVLRTTFTPTATGPSPISYSAPLRVTDPDAPPDGFTSGVVEVTDVTIVGGFAGSSGNVSITDELRVAGGVIITTIRYRVPGNLLLEEDSTTWAASGGGLTAFGGGLTLVKLHHRKLEWEPSILGPNGLLNQPNQKSEELQEASITLDAQSMSEARTVTGYAYDGRRQLSMEVSTTWKAEAKGNDDNPLRLGGFGALTLAPDRLTMKRYRDVKPGFYSVGTEIYRWIPEREDHPAHWEFDPTASDVTPAPGDRPGGINSQGGVISAPSGTMIGSEGGPDPTGGPDRRLVPMVTWFDPAEITWPTPLSSTQQNATADIDGTFAYSPPDGTVLRPSSAQQTLLAVFAPADPAYKPVTASVSIRVLKKDPAITWADPADIVHGTALSATQQNATADVAGSFVYAPPAGTILTAGTHTLKVTFTPDDGIDYGVVKATVSITVTGVAPANTPIITWSAPSSLNEGVALSAAQLNATVSDFSEEPIPGSLTYSPPAGTVLPPGSHVLHVFFQPDDDTTWRSTSATVTLVVTKITISWSKPLAVTVGTALDETQLNASANVEGAFAYNPPAGTVMGSTGAVSLNATFTPAEGGRAVLKTVTLTVEKDASTGATGTAGMNAGPYVTLRFRIDPDPTAPPVDLSDANLDATTLQRIGEQIRSASGLWQWEIDFAGANVPWLRRGDIAKITNVRDETGAEIILPPFLVQSVNTIFDPVGDRSYTRSVKGLAWTKDPVLAP